MTTPEELELLRVWMTVKCSSCKETLAFSLKLDSDIKVVHVEPCSCCLVDARTDGHRSGYEEGYDDGFETADGRRR